MLPPVMLPHTIPAHCYAAIGCIPCSAVALACPCISWSPQPTVMMLPLLVPCWNWPSASITFVLASSAWMPAIGAFSSSDFLHATLGAIAVVPWNRHSTKEPLLPTAHLEAREELG